GPGGFGQGQSIAAQTVERVCPPVARASARRVAALVGGKGAVAGVVENSGEGHPALTVFGKAVQQDHDPTIERAGVRHVECESLVGILLDSVQFFPPKRQYAATGQSTPNPASGDYVTIDSGAAVGISGAALTNRREVS